MQHPLLQPGPRLPVTWHGAREGQQDVTQSAFLPSVQDGARLLLFARAAASPPPRGSVTLRLCRSPPPPPAACCAASLLYQLLGNSPPFRAAADTVHIM